MRRREFLAGGAVLASLTTLPRMARSNVQGATHRIPPSASLNDVNRIRLAPGDRVEFQGGGTWRGKLIAGYSGASGAPITYGAYGSGPRPVIENPDLTQPTVQINNRSHLSFRDLDIRGGKWAFSLNAHAGHTDHVEIEDCTIGQGSASKGVWTLCWGQYHANHGAVRRCIIDSHYTTPHIHPDSYSSDGIVLNDGCSYWEVTENVIKDWYHNCLVIGSGSTQRPSSHNNVFRNLMTSPGTTYCRGFSVLGAEGACQYNEIHHNEIVDTTVRSQVGGDHNNIHHNLINGVKDSPMVQWNTAQGILMLPVNQGEWVCHDNEISKNTIVNCEDVALELDQRVGPGVYRGNVFNQDRIRYRARIGHAAETAPITVAAFNALGGGQDEISDNVGPLCAHGGGSEGMSQKLEAGTGSPPPPPLERPAAPVLLP